jgi:hypothetical protein
MPLLQNPGRKNGKEYIKRRDVVYGRLILKLMGVRREQGFLSLAVEW